jgi:hypothetical protein
MYDIRILKTIRTVLLDFEGDISFDEFVSCFEEANAHPDYSPEFDGVADLRKARLTLDDQEAEALAAFVVSGELSSGRWAILTASPHETALSILYEQAASEQHAAQVFSTVQAASAYLEVDLSGVLDP